MFKLEAYTRVSGADGLCRLEARTTIGGMKATFLILSLSDLVLLGLTTIMGLQVQGESGFFRHFLLGLMGGLYTCLVHVVTFMYFVVCGKIYQQALTVERIEPAVLGRVAELKSRALRGAVCGILSLLLAIILGAGIDMYTAAWHHLLAGFGALLINAVVFMYQFTLIHENAETFHRVFGE